MTKPLELPVVSAIRAYKRERFQIMKLSRKNEIKLVFLLALALVIFLSLFTFDSGDIDFLTSAPNPTKSNIAGFLGAYMAWIMLFLMGMGAYIVPFFIAVWGIMFLLEQKSQKFYLHILAALFSILAISSILSMIGPQDTIYKFTRGGVVGLAFSDLLLKYLGSGGTLIVITVLFLLSFLITTDFLVFSFFVWIFKHIKILMERIRLLPSGMTRTKATEKRKFVVQPATIPLSTKTLPSAKPAVSMREQMTRLRPVFGQKPNTEKAEKKNEDMKIPQQEKSQTVYDKPYEMPSIELLTEAVSGLTDQIKDDLKEKAKVLEDVLSEFGIEAKVVKTSKGPVITRYELEPASGVKVNSITSLTDDIALAMKAVSIRIIAPIPGKGTVGVEVPNSESTLVCLKDVLKSKEFQNNQSKLKLGLGKDISGTPIVTDLGDMPHLLIAGATGSGKTVCVNTIISALLFNAAPDELKFLMVDPKRVELAPFNNLPHLLAPVITDHKKVSHALNWLVNEMDSRYKLFEKLGVRNIDGYNKKSKLENLAVLPYIVVVIDELADLMMVSQQEIEGLITRLAQLSRAVGIHMIIATQRPSVDVITGVIKANFPARISFKVASKVDSRTVLDINGADKLLGRGDMLFMQPGSSKPIRVQGGLVGDDEILRLTTFIKAQRKPNFEEDIVKTDEKTTTGKKFEKDEIYEEAVKLVLQTKQASVSMLQRRLGVGYTRAARLIDMMEDESIVGPYQGSKPRAILIEDLNNQNA
ncbi:MAG: DNA translocase FtsK [Candidatus Omnitrophota bacterium]